MTPTSRSLKWLREEGWFCDKVEQPWNPHTKATKDLFGFADIIAVKGDFVLLVQTTSGDHVGHRIEKIRGIPAARFWVSSQFRLLVVHGWAKRGARGKRKVWTCRCVNVGPRDFDFVNE